MARRTWDAVSGTFYLGRSIWDVVPDIVSHQSSLPATSNGKMRVVKRTDFKTVGDYIVAQPAPARAVLKRVRATIRKALPRATEGISYQIPIYKLNGVMVLFFAGFQRHYSIYPATARVISALGKALAGRVHSKATIRFPLVEVVPTGLITRIAKARAAEVTEHRLAKTARKKTSKKR